MRAALPGATAVMKPSSTPAACKAVLKLVMSALIASWPAYVIGATQIGAGGRGPVVAGCRHTHLIVAPAKAGATLQPLPPGFPLWRARGRRGADRAADGGGRQRDQRCDRRPHA